MSVDKLRRQSTRGTLIWLSVTELGILEDPDRKRNRVTLLAVISSLSAADLPELSSELEAVRQQFSPADSHVDPLLLLLNDSTSSTEALEVIVRDRLGLDVSRYTTRDFAMLTNSGVEYKVEEKDNSLTTVKQDKRFCNIFEIGFRTRGELEQHSQSSKCQKAKLYKYYQMNKDKLLKTSHELGLEIEVVDPQYTALNLKLDFIGMTREKMHSRERINQPDRVVKDVISPYRYVVWSNRILHRI